MHNHLVLLIKTFRAAIKQFQCDLLEIIEDDDLDNEMRNKKAFRIINETQEILRLENDTRIKLLSGINNAPNNETIQPEYLQPFIHWHDTDCLSSAVGCNRIEIFDKLISVGFAPDDHYCPISFLGEKAKSILMLERLLVLGLEIFPSMLKNAIDKNNYELCKFLIGKNIDVNISRGSGIAPLIYACDGSMPEIVQLLIDAGADCKVTYPYSPVNGNLLDRVMYIPDEGLFCVPYAIEKAIILITAGLSPSTQYLSNFIEIIKRCDVSKNTTHELMLLCRDKKYFDSNELKQLCEPIIELVNTTRQQQIAELNDIIKCDSNISGIISDFVHPLEYRSTLGSVRFFQSEMSVVSSNPVQLSLRR
ncbi:MAG: ankyrin repeat domain-containing protein [Gammaproteobacteria bacterium]|nr:ankyrin repeat domain-containing protein [Gammaproteobacteria bacterium]